MTIRLSDITPSPDAFSVVMATGILSIAARDHHYTRISEMLGVLATVSLLVLLVLVLITALANHRTVPWTLTDPDVTLRLFTFVAACSLLDNRLSNHLVVLLILGVIAGLAWLALLVLSVRNLSTHRLTELRDQAHGAWLLVSVGTSGLATVTAQLSGHTGQHGWLVAAVPIWVLALLIYAVMTSLMVWRAVAQRLDRDGFEPDTWILMGSLAIAVVAGHDIHQQQARDWLSDSVHAVNVVTWLLATLWIPPLIYFGLHRIEQRPKLLQLTGAWWTLSFPLGTYSAATYTIAAEAHLRSLQTVALVFFWDALVVWLIVTIAGLLRIPRALSKVSAPEPQHPSTAAAR
jgi:tellurite resistance protein TehA-like permease